ncbi:MAG: right-handed parallel beta-helix repeat-containing protein [Rhodospirillales bacterium]|nr:right-handed parallel beta-helix repeat-containing protein [Rhodospirillales bacterium]
MLELRIERASGEVIELELTPGAKVPAIQAGDKVRIVTPAGQQVHAEVRGNDIVVTTSGDAGQAGQPIVFENMALYLGDDQTALAVVDAATGETIEVADVADLANLGATVPFEVASGDAPPPPPSPSGSSTPFTNSGDIDQPDDGVPDPLQAILERPEVGAGEQGRGGLGFTGSDPDPTNPTPTPEPIVSPIVITLNGNVVDGYIVGATVFADANGNGVQDTGEAFTTTGANGAFTLTGGSGPLVMTGGIDVSTGEFFKGTLTAPAGSTVVTPLTTLIQSLVEAGQTVAAAESAVKAAFGLASDLDLTDFDPVKGVEDGVTGAGDALAAAIQIQNTVVQAASVLQGAGGSGVALGTATDAVYAQLASAVLATPNSSPIDSAAEIQSIITSAANASSLGLSATAKTQVSNAAADAAAIINDIVAAIDALGSSGTTLLTDLAKIAYVAQNGSAEALYDALNAVQGTGNNADLTTATADYSAAGALNTAIGNAASEIGTVGTASDAGTAGDDVITGTAGNDTFDGGAGNDVISGGAGNDMLIGGAGNDILNGDAGNDTLIGGAGTNTLNGGAGIDTAKFSGNFADFTITATGGGTDVTLTIAGSAGSDSAKTVEILKFNDLTVRVAGGGSDYTTLTAAINAATAGERILLTGDVPFPSGTLSLAKKVSLQLAGSDPAVTIASDGALVVDGSLMGSVTGLDISGIPGTTAVRFTGLGSIASITTASGQTVTLAVGDLDGLTVSGAGTVSIAGGTVPDGDDLSGISSAISVPSGTLTLTAAQADGLTITGAGAVAVTALGSAQVDLSDITVTGAKTAAVPISATLAAGTDLGDFSVTVAANQTLTLSAAQADGATIGGAGNVTVVAISATTDLSDVDPTGTLTATVTSSLDISAAAADLGTVDTFQLAGALTLTAAQASGTGITGTGAVTITGLAATTNLSGVTTSGTVTVTVAASLDISGNANLGPVDTFTIDAGTLTLTAAQADGATITGGAVTIAGNVTASADLTGIASPLGFGADGTIDVGTGATLTLTVAQAAGQTITGTGTGRVLVDGNVTASANLTAISAAVDFTGNAITVAAGQTLTLTAAQAGDTAITGDGTVALSGNATGVDLGSITADIVVPDGATLTLNTAQLAALHNDATPITGGTVALSGNATSLVPLSDYVTADLAVASGQTLTLSATQASGLDLTGAGNVTITGLGTAAVDLSGIDVTGTAKVTVTGNQTLHGDTDLGNVTLEIAAGQTVTLTAAQASGAIITGAGTLVIVPGTPPTALDDAADFANWSVASIDLRAATLDLPDDALTLPGTSEFRFTFNQVDGSQTGALTSITGTDGNNTIIIDVSGATFNPDDEATIRVNISTLGGNDRVVFDFGTLVDHTVILHEDSTIDLGSGSGDTNDTLESSNGTVNISAATVTGVDNLEINSTIAMSASQFEALGSDLSALEGAGEILIVVAPGFTGTLDLSVLKFTPGGSTPPTVKIIADGYAVGDPVSGVFELNDGLGTLTINLPSDPNLAPVIVLLETGVAESGFETFGPLGGFDENRAYFQPTTTVFNGPQFADLVVAIATPGGVDGIGNTHSGDVDFIKFSGPIVLSANLNVSGVDVAINYNGYSINTSGHTLTLTAEQANGGTIIGTGAVVITDLSGAPADLDLSGITAASVTLQVATSLDLGETSTWKLGDVSLSVAEDATLTLTAAQADGMTIVGDGAVNITGLGTAEVDLSGIADTLTATATVSGAFALNGLTNLGDVDLVLAQGANLSLSRAQLDGRDITLADGAASATLTFGGDASVMTFGAIDAGIAFAVAAGRTLTLSEAQADGRAVGGAGNVIVAGLAGDTDLTHVTTTGMLSATVTGTGTVDISANTHLGAVDAYQVANGATLSLTVAQAAGLPISGAGAVTIADLGSAAVNLSTITVSGAKSALLAEDATLAAGTNLGGFAIDTNGHQLTLSAAQAGGKTIEGSGSVVVTDLGGAAADLSNISASASAVVSGTVILPAGTDLGDVAVTVTGTLTLAAGQANGATIGGAGAVFVTALAADTDLSDVDPAGTLTATVTGSIDIAANANLGTVEAFQVASGQTLILSADQAAGLPITGAGSVAVTGLGADAVDLSKVTVGGSRTLDVAADTALHADTNLGAFAITVADTVVLTLSAAQASGKSITGTGDVVLTGLGTAVVDLSGINVSDGATATVTGPLTLASGTNLGTVALEVASGTLTLTAAQANGHVIIGAGGVTVTGLGLTAVDLSGIDVVGDMILQVASSLTLASGTDLGDFAIAVDNGATLKLTAAQADTLIITGAGGVTVTGLGSTEIDLSAIAVTGAMTVQVTATTTLHAGTELGNFGVTVASGQTLTLTAGQADGTVISGGAVVVSGDVGANSNLTAITSPLSFDGGLIAVNAGTLTLTAAQADGQAITGAGNVIITGLGSAAVDLSAITATGTAAIIGNIALAAATDLGGIVLTVAAGNTLTLSATQADGLTITGNGSVVITGDVTGVDLDGIAGTLDVTLPATGMTLTIAEGETAILTVAEANAYDAIEGEGTLALTGNAVSVFDELIAKIDGDITLAVSADGTLILTVAQADGLTVGGTGAVAITGDATGADLTGITATLAVPADGTLTMTAAQVNGSSIDIDPTGKLVVDVTFDPLSSTDQALPVYDIAGVTVDGHNILSDLVDVWNHVEIASGSDADKFKLFWASQDAAYYAATPLGQNAEVNRAGVELANLYVDYLDGADNVLGTADDNPPILDVVQTKILVGGEGTPAFDSRQQSLHENLLNNLNDAVINSRFLNKVPPLDDPRSDEAQAFGDRPLLSGTVVDGVYSDLATASAVIAWDIAHGISYPDTLPGPYAELNGANTLTGTAADNYIYGGGGDDVIDGGGGDDTVAYNGDRGAFDVSYDSDTGTWTVADGSTANGDEGIDSLSNVEKIVFGDGSTLAFNATLANGFNVGTGNASTGFVIDTSPDGIEVGLKAKEAYLGNDLSPDMGTYHAVAGAGQQSAAPGNINPLRAKWNIEYSIDLTGSGKTIGDFDVKLALDTDPGEADSGFVLDFNAIPGYSTEQQAGVSGLTVLQDSQNLGFDFWDAYFENFGFDPRMPGEYRFTLTVADPVSGELVGETTIVVDVQPGAIVDGSRDPADDGEANDNGVAQYATLQAAIAAAAAGDVIVVNGAVADDTLTLDKALTLLIGSGPGEYDYAGIVYDDDGVLRIDMSALPVDTLDLSGLNATIAVEVADLGEDETLVLTAEQADGLTVDGDGTVVVTGAVENGDFSNITANLDLSGATLTGDISLPETIDDGKTLTLTAAQADGLTIGGDGTVIVGGGFADGFESVSLDADGGWGVDRQAPAGFAVDKTTFAGEAVLKQSIDATEANANVFRQTEGRKFDLVEGTTTLSVDLHVDESWQPSGDEGYRWAGLWGVTYNAAGENTEDYPIIEFTTLGGVPRFRAWDTDNQWHDFGLPTGFEYGQFYTLTITVQPDGSFLYQVGDAVYASSLTSNGAVELGDVILQGYNKGLEEAGGGHTYDIYWDNLQAEPNVYIAEDTDLSGIGGTLEFADVVFVAEGATLTLTAEQADGQTIIGDGTVTLTGDATGSDLSGISTTLAVPADGTLTLTAEQVDGASIDVDAAGTLVVDVAFDPLSTTNQALPNIDISDITVDGSNSPEAVWDVVEVTGTEADKFKLFWISLDQKYYAASPLGSDVGINQAFAELGNLYVAYLEAGGAPILDVVQTKVGGNPNYAGRQQTLHDNILGNLQDGVITGRFGTDPANDPRSEAAKAFGSRPYFEGTVNTSTGLYSNAAALAAVIGWDLAHGYDYTDDLSGPYAVLNADDNFTGNATDNYFYGGAGADTLSGGAGDDTLYGGAGDDTLIGGTGADALSGGAGIDTADYSASTAAVNVNLGTGAAQSGGDAAGDTLSGIENVTGSDYADILTGGAGDNVLTGGAGNDTLSGGAGDDTLIGGAGDDTLTGGAGDDTLEGGDGIDTAVYSGKASDFIIADDGTGHLVVTDTNVLNGDAGRDTVSGVEHLSFLDGTILVVGAGSHYATIQSAIDAAPAGGTIVIAGGTYAEALSVTKAITLKAAAGANVIVDPVSGSGLTIDGDLGGGDVTLKGLTFAGGSSGIYLNTNADVGTLTLDGVTVEDNNNYGLRTNSGSLSDLVVTDSTFENNGFAFSESGSSSHLKLYNFTGNATLTDVTIVGAPDGTAQNDRPDYAIELVGVENVDLETIVPTTPIGTVTFTNVTVSGEFHKNGVAIYNYGDVDGLTINGLDLSGAETNWGPVFNIDGITDDVDASDYVLTLPDNGAIVTELQGEVADQTDTDTVITGTSANDRLMGKTGDDTLYGGAGDDELYGADKPGQTAATVDEVGNDTLYGEAGNDKLYGGAGDDILVGGTGDDLLDGGAGNDVAAFSGARADYNTSGLSFEGGVVVGTIEGDDGTDTLSNIEVLKFDDGFHVLPGMSIQAAIDAASDGDVIHVEAGVYTLTETIVIDKAITLLGAQAGVDPRGAEALGGPALRTAGGPGESVIDGGGLDTLIRIAADNVTIDGFDIGNGTGDLIESEVAIANPTIRNSFVHDSSGDEGIQLRLATNALIENNHVYDTAGDGINLANSTGGVIRFNEVHDIDSPDAAIYVYGSTHTTIEGNLVYAVTNNDGIKLGDKNGSSAANPGGSIIDNVVRGTGQDGITVYMSGVTVSGNDVSGSTSENGAIYVSFNVTGVDITNNTIHDNGAADDGRDTYAIRIGKGGYNPTDVTIEGNTFEGNESQLFDNGGALNLEAVLAGNTFVDGGTLVAGGANPRTLTIAVDTDDVDTLDGTDAADALSGRAGNDSLAGGIGNDILVGGAGDDTLDGGAGIDTAGFSGAFGDYAIVGNLDGTFTVTDTRAGSPDGTDTLDGVEALSFAGTDGKVLLVGGSGYATIQAAIDAASAGDTIFIADGTYTLISTLNVNKDVTLQGESETGVIIDANAVSGYGVLLTASGATLSDFTLHGPAAVAASSYGIKVSPNGTATAISDITLQNLTVAESYKTQIDLNGVHDSTLSNITVNGTGTASGNGLTLTDSSNIIVNDLETIANPWGGVAIYTDGNHYPGGSDGITFTGSFSATESAATNGASPIYIQLTGNVYEVTNLTLPTDYNYAVTNSEFRPEGGEFTFFFDSKESADAFAELLGEDSLVSTPGADILAGDGYVFGAGGDDTLTGGTGDDRLAGGTGDDILDGGDGADTAVFSGNLADYTFGVDANGHVTVNDTNGTDGADTLINVETLKFADGSTALLVVNPADPSAYSTIQAAVDAAPAGATIVVTSGTYAPFGTQFGGPANVTIIAPEGATIQADSPSAPARIVDLRADGTTFSGFTIEGPGGLAEAGVHVGISISGVGVTVENNTIGDVLTGIQTNTQYPAGDNSITGNTVNAEYGISLQNTGNTVTGNTVTASVEGLGIYGGMVNTVSDNSFTITDGGEALALYPNKYNGSVSLDLITSENTVTVGTGTDLQDAMNLAGVDGTVNLGSGTYAQAIDITKAGLTLASTEGAVITVDGSGWEDAVTIRADGVTVSGLTIQGPVPDDVSYLTYDWSLPANEGGSVNTRGIVVKLGADDFTIINNVIQDIRNGILINGIDNTGSVTNNTIDNTKSGISVQYTDGAGITISGNVEGTYGNEWGLNIHLNGHVVDGVIVSNSTPISATPTADWQQALLAISDTNADWSVQDQAYTSGNRTHVTVDDTGSTTSQGSQLTPIGSLQIGVDAVVAGGYVHVKGGDYGGEDVVIRSEGLTIEADADAAGITLKLAAGIGNVTVAGEGDVAVTGNAADNVLTGGAGDDVLIGGVGDDTLDGGDGSDVASFAGARSGYTLTVDEDGMIGVVDANAADGDEGTNTLTNVEVLKFTDGFRVLDGMSIQAAVDAAEPGDTIYVEAGTYDGQVLVNKAGLAIVGMDGAKIAVGTPATTAFADRTVAFTVAANGVAISGFEMTGPLNTSFTDLDFATQGYVYGVFVDKNVQDLTLSDNTIYDVRTGVTFEGNNTADVSGNDIYNTRGAFLVRSDGVELHDNSFGTVGNEWDVTYLAGTQDGDYFTSPFVSETQYGDDMMALSAANNDMTIVDRRYGMNGDITNQYAVGTEERDLAFNFANRSHVEVEAGVDNTLGAATGEPTSRGNGLGHPRVPLDSLQDGVDAVVAGGYVHVRAGDYSAEDVVIRSEGITIDGDALATGINVELGAGIANVTLLGAADFTATGNALDNILSGGDGDDIFIGGDGNDIFIGGDGNDTFTGGAGNDTFVFRAGDTGVDTVADFEEGDVLDFSDILDDARELIFENDGAGNAQISYEGTVIAVIQDTARDSLTVDDSGNVVLADTTV